MLQDSDLQELLDRSRIADTIYAFCDYVDRGDVEAVVSLFAEDGLMDLGGGAVHHGHAELRDMFTDRFRLYRSTSFHCSGVRLVRYDGTTANTTTYLYGIHDAAELNRQMHLWGRYEDEMVNESGRWRFKRRHLRVAGLSHTAPEEVPRRFNRTEYHSTFLEQSAAAPATRHDQHAKPRRGEQPAPLFAVAPGSVPDPTPCLEDVGHAPRRAARLTRARMGNPANGKEL